MCVKFKKRTETVESSDFGTIDAELLPNGTEVPRRCDSGRSAFTLF